MRGILDLKLADDVVIEVDEHLLQVAEVFIDGGGFDSTLAPETNEDVDVFRSHLLRIVGRDLALLLQLMHNLSNLIETPAETFDSLVFQMPFFRGQVLV